MHRCLSRRFGMGPLRLMLSVCCVVSFEGGKLCAKEDTPSGALKATTSQAAKQEATLAIPMKRITPKHRAAVQQVITDCSLYRRMPTGIVNCQPDLFTFLMQHPNMLVEIWRELGISQVDMRQIDQNNFQLSDNAGTTARLTIVEQKCEPGAQNRIVMYADGAYEGKPFRRPVRAQCVLLLRSGSFRETNEEPYVAARLDTFVRVDRTSIKLFAKAMHPLVGKTADGNFLDTLKFVSNLSQAAQLRPAAVQKLVQNLPRVPPELQNEMLSIASGKKHGVPKKATRVARAQD